MTASAHGYPARASGPSGPSPQLEGRAPELAWLQAQFRRRPTHITLLLGQHGCGKTALLEAAAKELQVTLIANYTIHILIGFI